MFKSIRSPLGVVGLGIAFILAVTLLIPGLVQTLFSSGFFMPHRHCYLDNSQMIWLHGLSDFIIGVSYMAIAAGLGYLVFKARKDIPFKWMFLAFGLFIFSCGWTHFMEVWTLWHPTYWLSGAIKAVTAAASLATAAGIFFLIPHVFKLIRTAKASEERRQALAKAHADLEGSYKELQAFSYSLSHDIRAPLRTVRSFSSIVLDENRERLDGNAVMLLDRVVIAANRMEHLVEDVLALSRISRVALQSQMVDLEKLVQQLIQDRPELQPPKAQVLVESPLLRVQGDVASVNQCLENLLGNAVKFVQPGVTPQVRIWTQTMNGNVRLWVKDNGIGIATEHQQKIFEAFQRLHRQEEYAGTGIGLAIVHKAVERMGGKVGVESELGKGSRFWVELRAPEE